jgi:hypothetical protein
MITFNQFLESKRIQNTITECSHLMVEMNVNPYEYIYESLKEIDPILAEGFWDGVQSFAKNVWNAGGQFASNVGQGAKAGYKQAADTVAGPVAKFDAAERALASLVDSLKDKKFDKFRSSAKGFNGNVRDYLDRVLASLRVDKQQVPQLMQTQVKQNYGTRDAVQGQQAPAAAPAANPAAPLNAGAPAARRPPMRRTGTTGP